MLERHSPFLFDTVFMRKNPLHETDFSRTSSTQKLTLSNQQHIAGLITTCTQVDSIMLLSR